jgi:redox-sensitive bicupin YhaK (pirin superfamily)
MKSVIHKSEHRGHVNIGWLDSQHSFSFGSWHDPRYMGVSALRVINEDRVKGNTGFGKHAHDNMEILTYVLSGRLSHQDSMGNIEHITAGEWQLMSAGTGVTHSEMNSSDQPAHFLQIWVIPNVRNPEPTYQQIRFEPKQQPNQWHTIVSPTQETPLFIRQNANISVTYLEAGKALTLEAQKAINYVHVIEGSARINDEIVNTGDAIIFEGNADIIADTDAHLLWFDLPEKP